MDTSLAYWAAVGALAVSLTTLVWALRRLRKQWNEMRDEMRRRFPDRPDG